MRTRQDQVVVRVDVAHDHQAQVVEAERIAVGLGRDRGEVVPGVRSCGDGAHDPQDALSGDVEPHLGDGVVRVVVDRDLEVRAIELEIDRCKEDSRRRAVLLPLLGAHVAELGRDRKCRGGGGGQGEGPNHQPHRLLSFQ